MTTLFNPFKKMRPVVLILFITGVLSLLFAFAPKHIDQDKWVAPASADQIKNPVTANATNLVTGKELYTKTCYICHGKKGKGDGPKSAEIDKPVGDFTKVTFYKQTDGAIFWKITEGKKPMPSFRKELTDEQRWMVVNYIREFGKVTAK